MQIRSQLIVVGLTFALTGALIDAQAQPASVPGAAGIQENKQQSAGQDLSTATKNALSNVQAARNNIAKKDYVAAKSDISSAQDSLKTIQSNPQVGKLEGMVGSKMGGESSFSSIEKHLSGANQALSKNQPGTADSLLKKAEGLLKSIG